MRSRSKRLNPGVTSARAAVVRGNRKLEQPVFHGAAAEENFFRHGFKHLLVFKKERRRAAGDGR